MPCYSPIEGWRASKPNENGRFPVVFNRQEAQQDAPINLPCGKCIGCRLDQSRQWAVRCVNEASLHDDNCFLTLTYEDEYLPNGASLDRRDFQLFMKRLRKEIAPKKIRYYGCGEYGEEQDPLVPTKIGRPHFHAIIFGYDFDDKEIHSVNHQDDHLFISEKLDRLWGKGFASIGNVTFASAAYVARYCTKKINGDMAEDHYKRIDPFTGEIHDLVPEFSMCSLKPAIGANWLKKYASDLTKGYITHNGQPMAPPKYYKEFLRNADDVTIYEKMVENLKPPSAKDVELWHEQHKGSYGMTDRSRVKQEIKNKQANDKLLRKL